MNCWISVKHTYGQNVYDQKKKVEKEEERKRKKNDDKRTMKITSMRWERMKGIIYTIK